MKAQAEPQAEAPGFDSLNRKMTFRRNVDFNISAGTVTFHPKTHEVLLILNHKYHEDIWQLPKGRKDLGEDIRATAVRETHEETGYTVRLVPARVRTRATRPREEFDMASASGRLDTHAFQSSEQSSKQSLSAGLDVATIDDPSTEPVGMVTYSDLQASHESTEVAKLCFFYLATLVDPDAPPDTETQDPGEGLEARWMSVGDAWLSLRFEAERGALLCAETLWNRTNPSVPEHAHL